MMMQVSFDRFFRFGLAVLGTFVMANTAQAVQSCRPLFEYRIPHFEIQTRGEERSGEVLRLIQQLRDSQHLFRVSDKIETPENRPALLEMRFQLERMRNGLLMGRFEQQVFAAFRKEIEKLHRRTYEVDADGLAQDAMIELSMQFAALQSLPATAFEVLMRNRDHSNQLKQMEKQFTSYADSTLNRILETREGRQNWKTILETLPTLYQRNLGVLSARLVRDLPDFRKPNSKAAKHRLVFTFHPLSVLDFIETRHFGFHFIQLPGRPFMAYDGTYGNGVAFLLHDFQHAIRMMDFDSILKNQLPSALSENPIPEIVRSLNRTEDEADRAARVLLLFYLSHEEGWSLSKFTVEPPGAALSQTLADQVTLGIADSFYAEKMGASNTKGSKQGALMQQFGRAIDWLKETLSNPNSEIKNPL